MRSWSRVWKIPAAVASLAVHPASALGPHELLLIVNERSRESWEIAREYAARRGVPPENIVGVDVPESALRAEADISLDEFERHIRAPAVAAMRARGIEDHILAWVYSADLPARVRTDPIVSLHGATLVGGRLPEPGLIATGLWISALFRGPSSPSAPALPSASLELLKLNPAARALTPAMSLTWSGARGLDRETSLALIRRSAAAGPAWASGTVYLVRGTDIRAQCRQWQFDAAAREITALGVRAVVTSNFPVGARDVSGIMMGLASPDPRRVGAFLPGAVADHLTSLAAVFHGAAQTKLTAWLAAGAYAAAGTVTEPYAIWMKFPTARLFAHLANGCTVLEAYYQSVASPLQLFIVGDPLMAPRAVSPRVQLKRKEIRAPGVLEFEASAEPPGDTVAVMFLLDGRTVALQASPRLLVDASSLAPGYHRLRAVVFRGGEVRVQGFAEIGFEVGPDQRRVRILAPAEGAEVDERRGTTVRIQPSGGPRAIALFAGGRKVAEAPGDAHDLRVSAWPGGPGPVEVQAVAVYEDGVAVRSPPVSVRVASVNRPPVPGRLAVSGMGAERRWTLPADDPDGDALAWSWWVPVAPKRVRLPDEGQNSSSNKAAWTELLHVIALADVSESRAAAALWSPSASPPTPGVAAAVIGSDGKTLWCFGWSEDKSAWVLGPFTATNLTIRASRGRPARPAAPTRLILRLASDGALEGWTDDILQCRWTGAKAMPFRRVGVAAAPSQPLPGECLAEVPAERLKDDGRSVLVGDAQELVVRVSDSLTSIWNKVSK